ncbi:MAG: phospholipase [bacterium]|nr:phospholipase [bacterium]
MVKKINKSKYFRVFLCLLWFLIFVQAAETADLKSIEVVTTVPVETTLEPQGTKNAADTWVEMVNNARKTLDFAEFYLSTKKGEPLEPVINAIIKAAERGVKVRFLVGTAVNDDMETRTRDVLDRFKKHPNITTTIFNWKELNRGGLHAKYFIVDRGEIFVGSQNFDWRALKHIHETGLRIKSRTFADALTRIFEADWNYNNGRKDAYKKLKTQTPVTFQKKHFLVSSPANLNPPGVPGALKTLVRLIDSAQKKITIQLLSYHEGAWPRFTVISDVLKRAADRGVTVRMIVSDWNKRSPRVNDLKRLVQVPNIEIKFATIPRSSDGFIPYARVIHSKVMRVDDTISWVGTSNWARGYFYTSRNVEVVTRDKNTAETLDRLFGQLWKSPYTYAVDPTKEYKPPRIN